MNLLIFMNITQILNIVEKFIKRSLKYVLIKYYFNN